MFENVVKIISLAKILDCTIRKIMVVISEIDIIVLEMIEVDIAMIRI